MPLPLEVRFYRYKAHNRLSVLPLIKANSAYWPSMILEK